MRSRLLAVALVLLGLAVVGASFGDEQSRLNWMLFTTGGVLVVGGIVVLLSSFAPTSRSKAIIRIDWFVPFLRKKKKSETLSQPSFIVRAAKRFLPDVLFADRVSGKPGIIRKVLKRVGPTMLSSPLRRVIQAICLLLFLVLFFHVCWPYSAQPKDPGQVTTGWQFTDINQESGQLQFESDQEHTWQMIVGETVFLAHQESSDVEKREVLPFVVASVGNRSTSMTPVSQLSPDQLDLFLIGGGTWEMHELDPNSWPSHYAENLKEKEAVPAESFLLIDPLVSLSTAVASRSWVWSLACAGIILIVCVLIPRGFCGYICPLGTLIDLFDWAVAGRTKRFRISGDGWWVHIKYYLLAGTMLCAVLGVLVSGFVAAIPVVTRAVLFIGDPLQVGAARGWHQVPALNLGHIISMGMFVAILCLGFLRPRFWCKYVCPSGAIFSLGNLFRVTERKVESTCINCNKCVEICPFDAIKPDFTTRVTDCTLCQTCGGVCPTHAIKFVERWNVVELKVENDPPTKDTAIGRRGFMSLAAGTAAAVVGGVGLSVATKSFGAKLDDADSFRPVRPPGSVPEQEFLQMCIRCGECFKACPNNVLQPEAFQQGLEGLWTPLVNADWAGCESSCNACGQVCPTGAIRALPMEEKKVARMGLAIVNDSTCLPFANREACQLCVDECNAAGYHAIEFTGVHTKQDKNGFPVPGTGHRAPVVLADKCVGCGLCQTRCYAINVREKGLLDESAIIIEAGSGKEDRIMSGSYRQLRQEELRQRELEKKLSQPAGKYLIPDQQPMPPDDPDAGDSPFGVPQAENPFN